jgi:subtilase family serine protease
MSLIHRILPVGSLLVAFLCQTSIANAQPINLVIKLKERVSMQALADNAVKYGVVYTPEQIRAISGPSDADYANVVSELKQQGFEIVNESKTHLFISVRAEKQSVEDAFQTKLVESKGVRTALTPAFIPASLSLVDVVVGLDNHRKLQPRYKVVGQGTKPTDDNPGILPATIKTTYGFDPIYAAGFTGKGQHIAIATYDGLHVTDITAYYQKSGLTPGPSVDVVSFNGTAAYAMDSAMETELDAEFSGMIAPEASIHIFASAENSDAGEAAMFTAILDDGRAHVVNYSWGSCEPNLSPDHKTAMDTIYARAVAQGVNIMVASGDSGNAGCGDGKVAADYPASHPDVVAVGGTTLVNSGGTFETAWSGSGGGISALFPSPSYQAGFAAPYTMRSLPDVAFNADPNSGEAAWEYADLDGSQSATAPSWIVLGGTSIAAPQWSGFLTLVGEARAKKGKAALGFLNPIIYGFSSAQYSANFNDVTQGSNGFSAGAGWDAVTGWGSMKASTLFTTLTQ